MQKPDRKFIPGKALCLTDIAGGTMVSKCGRVYSSSNTTVFLSLMLRPCKKVDWSNSTPERVVNFSHLADQRSKRHHLSQDRACRTIFHLHTCNETKMQFYPTAPWCVWPQRGWGVIPYKVCTASLWQGFTELALEARQKATEARKSWRKLDTHYHSPMRDLFALHDLGHRSCRHIFRYRYNWRGGILRMS